MEESERKPDDKGDGTDTEDLRETTAPSIGPNTTFEKDDPEERLARHEQSDVDAMGLDKRREVIGGNYSASFGRQVMIYAIVAVGVIGAGIGLKALADHLDQPPSHVADQAPWTGTNKKPTPLQ